jgi:hypothetical protein
MAVTAMSIFDHCVTWISTSLVASLTAAPLSLALVGCTLRPGFVKNRD